jgi:hypothetical protein
VVCNGERKLVLISGLGAIERLCTVDVAENKTKSVLRRHHLL